MKKKTISFLYVGLVIEFAILLCMLGLSSNNAMFYIGVGVSAILLGITIFFIIEKQLKNNNDRNQLFSSLIDKLMEKNNELEQGLLCSTSSQEQLNNTFEVFCNKTQDIIEKIESIQKDTNNVFVSSVEKLEKTLDDKITDSNNEIEKVLSKSLGMFEQQRKDTVQSTNTLITDVQQRLINQIEQTNKFISNQFDIFSKSLDELNQETRNMLSGQIQIVKDGICEIEKTNNTSINEQISTLNSLVNSFDSMVSGKLSEIRDEYERMLGKLNSTLTNQICEIETKFDTSLSNTNECITSHNNELSTIIAENNKSLINSQNTKFESHLDLLTTKYDSIMTEHIAKITAQTQNSIKSFVSSTNSIFAENANKTEALIETEQAFINEYINRIEELNNLISSAYSVFSKSVDETVKTFEQKIETQIDGEKQVYIEQIGILKTTLQEYSDSFVEKSTQAVAERIDYIQNDAKEKYKEICNKITEFVSIENSLANECKQNNSKTTESILRIISQHNLLVENIKKANTDNLESLKSVLDTNRERLANDIKVLNENNSQMFSKSMDDYREKFVLASSDALAKVQIDNVDAITDAHTQLSTLSKTVDTTLQSLSLIINSISNAIIDTKSAIENGNNTSEEIAEDFASEVKKLFRDKLEDISGLIGNLTTAFETVQKSIDTNTTQYQSTLQHIQDSQNAMNSLSERDIKLLEELYKK